MKHLFFKIKKNRGTVLLFIFIAAFYFRHGCLFRFLTGISCPGCGMTRALTAALKLDFALAYEMHPLVFLLPLAVLVYFSRRLIPKKFLNLLCCFTLIMLVAVYIMRMNSDSAVVYYDFESGMLFKLLSKLNQINIF